MTFDQDDECYEFGTLRPVTIVSHSLLTTESRHIILEVASRNHNDTVLTTYTAEEVSFRLPSGWFSRTGRTLKSPETIIII